jgi:ABC-type multidrug transport system ATPase subunit
MIIRLVSNGVLLEGGYLFWDEPEANLNPTTQRAVARAILELARSGTQVFVATHSVFMLREIELLLDNELFSESVEPRYIGLFRESQAEGDSISRGVRAEDAADPADLTAIAALEAESSQSLRYLGI